MVSTSAAFMPAMINGITIHPENPLEFDFIVGTGDQKLQGKAFEEESTRLIKYFLAALTVPEDQMWVNLSPYEKDRIIPQGFGTTEMGRDLLAQDYILKQLTASLMYPEKELGKKFWDRVYQKIREEYGTIRPPKAGETSSNSQSEFDWAEIPMNTFNKVWIVPEKAIVYEHGNSAFVVKSHLKVMLEEDYEASRYNQVDAESRAHGEGSAGARDKAQKLDPRSSILDTRRTSSIENQGSSIETAIIKEVILPEIEKEVNEGKTFSNLRQIYNSVILAAWFKQNLKQTLLGQVYVDKAKTKGVDVEDKTVNKKIYEQYLEAFKKGVYNYIKEDTDPVTKEVIPRKYFSGGTEMTVSDLIETYRNGRPLTLEQQEIVGEYLAGLKEYNQGQVRVQLAELSENMPVARAKQLIQENRKGDLSPVASASPIMAAETLYQAYREEIRAIPRLSQKIAQAFEREILLWVFDRDDTLTGPRKEIAEITTILLELLVLFNPAQAMAVLTAGDSDNTKTMVWDRLLEQTKSKTYLAGENGGVISVPLDGNLSRLSVETLEDKLGPEGYKKLKEVVDRIKMDFGLQDSQIILDRKTMIAIREDDPIRQQSIKKSLMEYLNMEGLSGQLKVEASSIAVDINLMDKGEGILRLAGEIEKKTGKTIKDILQKTVVVGDSTIDIRMLKVVAEAGGLAVWVGNPSASLPPNVIIIDQGPEPLRGELANQAILKMYVEGQRDNMVRIVDEIYKNMPQIISLARTRFQLQRKDEGEQARELYFNANLPFIIKGLIELAQKENPVTLEKVEDLLRSADSTRLINVLEDAKDQFYATHLQAKHPAFQAEVLIPELQAVTDALNNLLFTASSPISNPAKPKILVVDDNEDARQIATDALGGYEVILANNREDALAKMEAAGQAIQLVISDMNMPGKDDGIILARELKDKYPHLPVILNSVNDISISRDDLPNVVGAFNKLRTPLRPIVAKILPITRLDIETRMRKVIEEYSDTKGNVPVTPPAEDLIANEDSLGRYEIALRVGEEFNIWIPDEDIPDIKNFGDAVNYLAERLGVEQGGQPGAASSPVQILVVDDNQMDREMTVAFLKAAGHNVTTAASAQEALKILKQKGPSYFKLIHSDFEMPGMNGIQFARELKKINSQLPVIINSNTMSELMEAKNQNPDLDNIKEIYFKEERFFDLSPENIAKILKKYGPSDERLASSAVQAPANPGGIDLNPALLDLQIKRDGNGVPLPLPQQPIENMRIEGFIPIIINVTPVTNLPMLLGLADEEAHPQEANPELKARELEEISALN